jgi:hypothetical protein
MLYIVELQKPASASAYVVEEADSQEDARALVDARLGRNDEYEDVQIVAVHTIH